MEGFQYFMHSVKTKFHPLSNFVCWKLPYIQCHFPQLTWTLIHAPCRLSVSYLSHLLANCPSLLHLFFIALAHTDHKLSFGSLHKNSYFKRRLTVSSILPLNQISSNRFFYEVAYLSRTKGKILLLFITHHHSLIKWTWWKRDCFCF